MIATSPRSPLDAHCPAPTASLSGAWPFGVVEAIWCVIALRRYRATTTASA